VSKPTIAVLYAPGTTAHTETALAVELAGGLGEVVLLSDLISKDRSLDDYQGLVIPGGFSWGDHIAPGRVFAAHLIHHLYDDLVRLREKGRPLLGIGNGFQVLCETGILPDQQIGKRSLALLENESGKAENRWVVLKVADSNQPWLQGFPQEFSMPVSCSAGRLSSENVQPAFLYVDTEGRPTEEYPQNPTGSRGGIAGVIDSSGLVLGMMPHPERVCNNVQGCAVGLRVFANMIAMLE
jgi:phosphoribosylformylglycinamidine synthase I